MAVPGSGEIHFKGLHNEKNEDNYAASTTPSGPVTMYDLINGGNGQGSTVSYTTTNQNSSAHPNTTTPHGMDEWHGYDHDTVGIPNAPGSLAYTATSTTRITFSFAEDPNATKVYFYQGSGASFTLFTNEEYKFNGQNYIAVDGSGQTSIVVNDGSDDTLYNPSIPGYQDISLSANDYMDVKYKSWNTSGYSGHSSDIRGWTLPETPGSLSESGIDHDSITINWAAPAGGASSYRIYAGIYNTMTNNSLATGETGTSKTYNGLTPNTQYNWWIAAVGGGGDTGAYAGQYAWTLPDVPTNLHEDSLAHTSVTLDWDAPTGGADSYSILIGASPYSQSNALTDDISGTSHAVSGLSASTTYYWNVRSTGDAGQDGVWSSTENFATTAAPIAISIAQAAGGFTTDPGTSVSESYGNVGTAEWTPYTAYFIATNASALSNENTTFTPSNFDTSTGVSTTTNRRLAISGTTTLTNYVGAGTTQTYGASAGSYTAVYFRPQGYLSGAYGTGNVWMEFKTTITNPYTGTDNLTMRFTWKWIGGGRSDLRVKQDVTRIGATPDGIPWYSFRFKDDPTTLWSGVIAQDLLKMGYGDNVVYKDKGIFHVMYHELNGVEMRPIINGVIQ